MKTIFIFYSHTGNGERVAEYLKAKGVTTRRINVKRDLPKSFFWSVFIGGFLGGIRHKARLKDFDVDLSDVDHVILGSPIWNDRLCSAMNAALAKLNLEGKRLSFVLYSGSGKAAHAEKRIHKEYPEASIVVLQEPKKYPEGLARLEELSL